MLRNQLNCCSLGLWDEKMHTDPEDHGIGRCRPEWADLSGACITGRLWRRQFLNNVSPEQKFCCRDTFYRVGPHRGEVRAYSVLAFRDAIEEHILPHADTIKDVYLQYCGSFQDQTQHQDIACYLPSYSFPALEILQVQSFVYVSLPAAYPSLRELKLGSLRIHLTVPDVVHVLRNHPLLEVFMIESEGYAFEDPTILPLKRIIPRGRLRPLKLRRFGSLSWTYEEAQWLFETVDFQPNTSLNLRRLLSPERRMTFDFLYRYMAIAISLEVLTPIWVKCILPGSVTLEVCAGGDNAIRGLPMPCRALAQCPFNSLVHLDMISHSDYMMTRDDWKVASKNWISLQSIYVGDNSFVALVVALSEEPVRFPVLKELEVRMRNQAGKKEDLHPGDIIEMVIVRKRAGVALRKLRFAHWLIFKDPKDPILGPHFVHLLKRYADEVYVDMKW